MLSDFLSGFDFRSAVGVRPPSRFMRSSRRTDRNAIQCDQSARTFPAFLLPSGEECACRRLRSPRNTSCRYHPVDQAALGQTELSHNPRPSHVAEKML